MNIHSIRNEYQQGELTAENLERDPFVQFGKWLQEAVSRKVAEPTAMALATVGRDGFPQVRTVLLKSFGAGGFVFFTNLQSEKGQAIAADNRVSLLFFWPELQRQVRITGSAERVSDAEADEYFRTRPVNSRLGAWASEQSQVIPSRRHLEHRFFDYEKEFAHQEIPRPHYWGGYRVVPLKMEFWQGRENRLHDRFLFLLQGGQWTISRLAP